jgi:hypothetical protein
MASKFGFGLSFLKTRMDRTASLNRRSTIRIPDKARERSYGDAICTWVDDRAMYYYIIII